MPIDRPITIEIETEAQASTRAGDMLYEECLRAALMLEDRVPNSHAGSIIFSLWLALTRHIATHVDITPQEIGNTAFETALETLEANVDLADV